MKHGVIMVFSLILALCLMGVVSANENVTDVCEDTQIQIDSIDIGENEIIHSQDTGKEHDVCDVSCSIDSISNMNIENEDLKINTDNIDVEIFKLTKIDERTEKNVLNENTYSPNGYVTYNDCNLLMLPLIERNIVMNL